MPKLGRMYGKIKTSRRITQQNRATVANNVLRTPNKTKICDAIFPKNCVITIKINKMLKGKK